MFKLVLEKAEEPEIKFVKEELGFCSYAACESELVLSEV